MSDVVVVLPGIMGSTLARHGAPVWSPSPRALLPAILGFRRWVGNLTLPDGIGDEPADDGVEPTGLMPDVHALPGLWTPVKGYDRLVRRLHHLGYRETADEPGARPGNLLLFPYDWRLSNRHNARRLGRVAEPFLERWRAQGGPHADARIVVVAHSMGGLVARRYVECEGGADHTRKVVTLGTPYRGSARAVEQLVNGMPRLLGAFGEELTRFARSLPSIHQLMPEYACVDDGTAGELRRTTEVVLPELRSAMVADAMAFHDETNAAADARADGRETVHAIVGSRQPTATTLRLVDGRVQPLTTMRAGGETHDDFGDGTVPTAGAIVRGLALDTSTVRRIPDQHGNLQRNAAALDELQGVLEARSVQVRDATRRALRVAAPDLVGVGEPFAVDVVVESDDRHRLEVTVTDEDGRVVDTRSPRVRQGHAAVELTTTAPGAHTVTVTTLDGAVDAVTALVLAWPS